MKMKFDLVETWLNNVSVKHSDSKCTRDSYKLYMQRFCDFIDKTPEQILEEYREFRKDKNLVEFQDIFTEYIENLTSQLYTEGFASSSVRRMISPIKSFFNHKHLPLHKIEMGKARVEFHNKDIEKSDISSILKIAKPRDRAFFCLMAQSGIRPSTICQLRIKHFENLLEENPPIPNKIEIPQEIAKGKYKSYFTFCGEESIEYLKAYLQTRGDLTENSLVFSAYSENKPLNTGTITHIFKDLVDRLRRKGILKFETREKELNETVSGKSKLTKSEFRLYNLRRFFRKYAGFGGYDYVQFWLGHTLKNQDEHYFSTDREHHRKQYREKALPHLRINKETPSETQQVIQENIELKKIIADMARRLEKVEEVSGISGFDKKESEVEGYQE